MLELKNINKSYKLKDFSQQVLNNINLKFRSNEFVAILGPSGSGKTTLLNVIGGLDQYDDGDLIIKGKSTKKFKSKNWDGYRNKSVGFIFQNYNLISHISILNNVEMGMTLSGKKGRYRKTKAIELLEKVGLKEHIHKKPNQLSGGQMQRVAIARALANDPEIILADEPTGALDSKTSIQIMELIKEISQDKLVVMVTHNGELAEQYADRIIKMQDGVILEDTNPVINEETNANYKLNRTSMNIFTALHLSLNNIRTKKGRTFLTAFASSIGIIGIALILSLSNGFSKQIDIFEREVADAMPIIISETRLSNQDIEEQIKSGMDNDKEYSDVKEVNVEKKSEITKNNLSEEYIKYLNDMPKEYLSNVMVDYSLNYGINLIQKSDNKISSVSSKASSIFSMVPYRGFDNDEISELYNEYYDLLEGKLPTEKEEILLEIKNDNTVSKDLLNVLGIDKETATFEELLNANIKVVFNDDFYQKFENYYTYKAIDEDMYNNSDNLELKVCGIIRVKKDKSSIVNSSCRLYYTNMLQKYVMDKNSESEILISQKVAYYNVLTGEKFGENDEQKRQMLLTLGDAISPTMIYLYPKDFDTTSKIVEYLEQYNQSKEDKDKIGYLNQAELLTNTTDGIMTGITVVLVAFSSISLIVSSIMLGIITYISVLERTKEIGILRSLGARKKDIRRVFNAETSIIGIISGLLGIGIAYLLIFPINKLLLEHTSLENVAVLNPVHALILIGISVVLTLVGGSIPAHIASKKDPVNALRTE